MSYTNETTYYGLPLPTGSDKSTFTDNNTAFQAVDAALHTAAEQSSAAADDLVTVKADIVDLKAADVTMSGDIDAAEINIEALQQKELLQDTAIDAVKADAFDMITAYNEPTATSAHAYNVGDFFIYNDVLYRATASIDIGDTIVPDTNCATTNVTTEIGEIKSDLTSDTVVASVSTDNVKTEQELLNALYSAAVATGIDLSKARFVRDDGTTKRYSYLESKSATRLIFSSEIHANTEKQDFSYQFLMQASGSLSSICHITYTTGSEQALTGTWVDNTSNVQPTGSTWAIVV